MQLWPKWFEVFNEVCGDRWVLAKRVLVSRGAQLSSEKFRLSIILSVNNFDWPIRTPSDCIRLILFLAIFHNFHNFITKNNLNAQLASPISYEPIDKCHDWNKRQTLIETMNKIVSVCLLTNWEINSLRMEMNKPEISTVCGVPYRDSPWVAKYFRLSIKSVWWCMASG